MLLFIYLFLQNPQRLCAPFKYYVFSVYFKDSDCQIIDVIHLFCDFIPNGLGPNLIN